MDYKGAELGPIRPPSESESLLLRVTRNCPWNRCAFCGLYKKEAFSLREKSHILEDIAWVSRAVDVFRQAEGLSLSEQEKKFAEIRGRMDGAGAGILYPMARRWYRHGMASVFLQDANSLIYPPEDLAEILQALRAAFPEVRRITSYARSHTLAGKSEAALRSLRAAGLDRLHIGMESGSDKVLELVGKGATKQMHITAGLKGKAAGFEISEYLMPGLGGMELSEDHALESADVLNQVDPDFIRLRTLAIPDSVPLARLVVEGRFTPADDLAVVREIRQFLLALGEIHSTLLSDHILNLLPDIQGRLPRDKAAMVAETDWLLGLSPDLQLAYRVGRRAGLLSGRRDFEDPGTFERVQAIVDRYGIREDNLDSLTTDLMKTFI
jgi:hypothetical protein